MNLNADENKPEIAAYQLQQFQHLILQLFQCCQERVQYQSEKFGLPEAELRCLMHFGGERYLTPKGLSSKMNVVKSRVTKLIQGLEQKKMVERIADPRDSRAFLLCLTAAGQKRMEEIRSFYDDIHHEVLRRIAPEQRAALLNNLDLLNAAMHSIKELMV